MTFRNIHLLNFQSHEETSLDLSAGVNIIVGPSDSGKSSIIRALRWLVWNKPGGTAFRSTWGGDTAVGVLLEGNTEVARIRTDKENEYTIEDEAYHAFGAEPPEDVTKLLNLNEVNLQQQLDRPFLLDSSPGQVAQYLNEVAHLDVIDRALQRLGKWTREIEGNIRTHESNLERLEEALDTFDYLPDMEQDIQDLEGEEQELVSLRERWMSLSAIPGRIRFIEHQLAELDSLRSLGPAVTAALRLHKEHDSLVEEHTTLLNVLERLDKVEEQVDRIKPLQSLKPAVEAALTLAEDLDDLQNEAHRLVRAIESYKRADREQSDKQREAKQLHKQFDKELGDRCPLCRTKQVKRRTA